MASEWELGMGMGMEFGFGMGSGGTSVAPSLSAHAPNHAVGAKSPAYLYGLPSTDTLRIDDLLDFSNHQVFSGSSAAAADNLVIGYQAAESSSVTGSRPFAGESGSHVSSFADEIYIPSEEAAELEWLSKFVEESFSDVPYPASAAAHLPTNGQIRVGPTSAFPARGARSKRSRAASTNFTPNLVPNQSSSSSSTSSSSSSDFPPPPPAHISAGGSSRKQGLSVSGGGESTVDGVVRRCTHCASEKTPQWRTGPMGPKTLCNACGVRYKSGRLVPEYRPAASPTFVLTQHSNSHRKVMELRRQKESLHLHRHENVSAGGRQPDFIYHN